MQVPGDKLIESRSLIDRILLEYLEIKWPITPTFYAHLTVRKSLVNRPGCPIVSGIGCHTETASKYMDSQLRPHVMVLPLYLKATLELLKVIEGLTMPPGAILVAIDIYSSIPHQKGIEVISGFLREEDRNNWKLCNFVATLLEHILTTNIFLFNGSTYLYRRAILGHMHLWCILYWEDQTYIH